MLMSLFSVFDPTSYFSLSLSWMVFGLIYIYVSLDYFLMVSGGQSFKEFLSYSLNVLFKEVSMPLHKVLGYMCMSVCMYLMISNLLGLIPFMFTVTAHPMVTLGWGLVFWISFVLMGFFSNFNNSVGHLVPEGSPLMLSPFLVLIESVSHLIRPFTLSIRLAANMMAGHLIIGLLASISLMNGLGFLSSVFLQSILLILEFAVAIIQGFVFSILILLYALEYY